jgi:SM-20-related protein
MADGSVILVQDDLVPVELQLQLGELIRQPIWSYGWRSNKGQDRYCFWHAHFAGGDGNSRRDCSHELESNRGASSVFALWKFLSAGLLRGHQPLRVYANSHTYGIEGYVHTDSTDEENYFTTLYYAHPVWRKNWSGELLFFERDSEEIIKAIYPRSGRIVSFPGAIPHMAHAPSRECPELRVSIVVKSQLVDEGMRDA